MLLVYDFEVFKYDWMVVIVDLQTKEYYIIQNDPDGLMEFYKKHQFEIWCGYNSRHYDQYILKGILAGFNPKEINDYIIVKHKDGWQFSPLLNKWKLINYDIMPSPPVGLKTLEGFLGSDIRETEVPFDIDRKLTEDELNQVRYYCTHDVEETIKVLSEKIDDFNAMFSIVKDFDLPLGSIGKTEAQITAEVLQCQKTDFDDEFDYFFLPCLRLKKYSKVKDFFTKLSRQAKEEGIDKADVYTKRTWTKAQSLKIDVAGVPHVFGFGGLHGAPDHPIHKKGLILHVDVGSYYPSMLIAWGLVTRAAKAPEKYKGIYDTRMQLKAMQVAASDKKESKKYKKAQLPYKKMLNALSGAMKDNLNPAYDPRNNNTMCINGQLMLLDLIEHLEEKVPGFELIQSNTDGLIIFIPDTDESFNAVDDVCYEWECRCSTDQCNISLALDTVSEIYQKDVNNYLWIEDDGKLERKGTYLKELSSIDNDLPILNKALVDYMSKGVPVEQTINECDELIMFQKVVKLSDAYDHVEHEEGDYEIITKSKKNLYKYKKTVSFSYKSYRVFASSDPHDGRILKVKPGKNGEKFANTSEHCFIWNASLDRVPVPDKLDRSWYIEEAKKRLKQFKVED